MTRSLRAYAIAVATLAALAGVVFLTGAAGARAEGGWWIPSQQLTWYWQLTGTVNNDQPVAAYDIDGFENSAAEVASLQGLGKHVICYIDVGTAEDWRPDYSEFPPSVLGRPNGWPGERWLDIRQLSVLEPIMTARFQMCKTKGFDAVEPDNIEGYANDTGFPLTAQDQLTYNEWVAEEVHSLGMAVLQKNDGPQTPELLPYFDGALTEQCNQYKECSDFQPYLAAGKPVLNAEYSLPTAKFCAADNAAGIMGARYNLALNGKRFEPCFAYVAPEQAPTLTELSVKKGPASGETSVTITGAGFTGATAVEFGSLAATSFKVHSPTSIAAVSPPGTTGLVEVTVTTPDGTSAPTAKDHFTYGAPTVTNLSPDSGPAGTAVTVTGSGFNFGSATPVFKFAETRAAAASCTSSTTCTVEAPAAETGTVSVTASVSGKTSAKRPLGDRFTYTATVALARRIAH